MMCEAIKYPGQARSRSSSVAKTAAVPTSITSRRSHAKDWRRWNTAVDPRYVGCYHRSLPRYIPAIKAAAPDAPLVVHFHNDTRAWSVDTVMALGAAGGSVTTSVNGIGERTGNAPHAQVLLQLRYLFGIENPELQVRKTCERSPVPGKGQRHSVSRRNRVSA